MVGGPFPVGKVAQLADFESSRAAQLSIQKMTPNFHCDTMLVPFTSSMGLVYYIYIYSPAWLMGLWDQKK